MARSATTRYAVLGMLTRRPMTGYELREDIAGSIGHFWSESFGQLYPTLRDLAADGLVEGHVSGTRRRIEYSLTDADLRALRHWLAEDVETLASARNELLLKVFFGRHAEPGVLQGHLREHHRALGEALARYARSSQLCWRSRNQTPGTGLPPSAMALPSRRRPCPGQPPPSAR